MYMTEDISMVKCRHCGSVLKIKSHLFNTVDDKKIKCPTCHEISLLSQCVRLSSANQNEKSVYQYPNHNGNGSTTYDGADHTELSDTTKKKPKNVIGVLKIEGSNNVYQLLKGRQIVGRQASSSQAQIQINMGDARRLSREHLVVEVQSDAQGGFRHIASLCKEKLNATFINNDKLDFGDRVILRNGDIIRLPDITMVFVCEE